MKDVVYASIAVKWYFPEFGWQRAATPLEARLDEGRELLAPDLIAVEFASLLRKSSRVRFAAQNARELRGTIARPKTLLDLGHPVVGVDAAEAFERFAQ